MMPHKSIAFSIIVTLLVSACSIVESDIAPEVVTSTPQTVSLAQFPTETVTPITTSIPTTFPTNTPPVCQLSEIDSNIQYVVDATLDWDTKRVEVEQAIQFMNTTADDLTELVFHMEANRSQNVVGLYGITDINGALIEGVQLEETRLIIPLAEPLKPGCETGIRLAFNIQLPNIRDGASGRIGYLGFSANQINLGHWLATVGIYQGDGNWYTPRAYPVGEQVANVSGNYEVSLRVTNPPIGLQVAAPGRIVSRNDYQWTYELNNARDFALSISDRFQTLNTNAGNVNVALYYIPANQPVGLNAPDFTLETIAKAVTLYTELFGEYPYQRLVIVEGDFPDGMEFSGLAFVSEAWFRTWKGLPNEWLTLITVHEVAHQWWYLQVGNDQGTTPYLDEALATFSELLYFEEYHPELVDWWWNFRIYAYGSTDPVDASVYYFNGVRPYINAIYLRGVAMLESARLELGEEAFFGWLNRYLDNNLNQIAEGEDFWGSLTEEEYQQLASIRQAYLANPNIGIGIEE